MVLSDGLGLKVHVLEIVSRRLGLSAPLCLSPPLICGLRGFSVPRTVAGDPLGLLDKPQGKGRDEGLLLCLRPALGLLSRQGVLCGMVKDTQIS